MSNTETETEETTNCLYPGCERPAVPPRDTGDPRRKGPPPRYCELEEHNAASTYQALKALEQQ